MICDYENDKCHIMSIIISTAEGQTTNHQEDTAKVTRAGHECGTSIKPGDRVWMMAPGCTRKFPRADVKNLSKVPDSRAFEAVTVICVPTMTAYQALIEIGRLEEGVSVLFHSAADIMGQAAVHIARTQGAEVFLSLYS